MRSSSVKVAFLALIGAVTCAPSAQLVPILTGTVAPIPPSDDPFYLPPAGYESAKPGDILKTRKVPSALSFFQIIPTNLKAAYQLLYRTTNSIGEPEVTVTTILVPYNADPRKLLSYQVAEDSGGQINCAPSYTLQTGSNTTYAGTGGIEAALIASALNQGWIVNTPDWEGPKSTFVAGFQAGQATLDSVRAALKSGKITSIESDAKVAMWGYSGGALASEWASELNVKYAPELKFVGMAIGGVTPNVANVFNSINQGPFAGLSAAGVLSLGLAYSDFGVFVQNSLIESKKAAFNQAAQMCFYADVTTYAFQDIYTYFKQGREFLNQPQVQAVFKKGATMGLNGTPQMPVFVYKSVNDEISPIADTDKLVNQFCDAGASITYVRETVGEHFTQAATATGDVINFLIDRFNSVPISGCQTRTVFNDALGSGTGTLAAVYVNALLNALQVPVGPAHV